MTQNLQFLAKNPKVPNFIPAIVMNDKLQELVCDSWSIHSWQIPIYDCSNHLLLLKSILAKSVSKPLITPLFSFSADLQHNSPQFSNAITVRTKQYQARLSLSGPQPSTFFSGYYSLLNKHRNFTSFLLPNLSMQCIEYYT